MSMKALIPINLIDRGLVTNIVLAPTDYHKLNLVFMLDAANTDSYSGTGQVLANLVVSPADGSLQTDYDFQLGSTSGYESSDPLFVGVAGVMGSFFDTGESPATLKYFTKVSANTAFLNSLHKSGAKYTIEIWCVTGSGFSGIRPAFDTGGSDQGGAYTSRSVSYLDTSNISAVRNTIKTTVDSGGGFSLSKSSSVSQGGTAINMFACSIDATGEVNSFLYTNGSYDQVGGVDTWDGTYVSPGTSDPVNKASIFVRADLATNMQGRFYLMRVYNTNLSKAQLDINYVGTLPRYSGTVGWNILDKTAGMSLTGGALIWRETSSDSQAIRSTAGKASGKWYWEVTIGNGINNTFGIRLSSDLIGLAVNAGTTLSCRESGSTFAQGITDTGVSPGGWVPGDILMFALNMDNGKVWVGKNGVWPTSGNPAANINPIGTGIPAGTYHAYAWTNNDNSNCSASINCGTSSFAYTPPSGFLALG